MKRLLLMRHAKSSYDHFSGNDIDRTLNEQGIHDAEQIGKWLKQRCLQDKIKPTLLLTSNAVRAKQTAEIIATQLDLPATTIKEEPDIYVNYVEKLLSIINHLPNTQDTVILIGHDPSISHLISNYLLDDTNPLPGHRLPTCGICCIRFNTNAWENISKEGDEAELALEFFEAPKHEDNSVLKVIRARFTDTDN